MTRQRFSCILNANLSPINHPRVSTPPITQGLHHHTTAGVTREIFSRTKRFQTITLILGELCCYALAVANGPPFSVLLDGN